MALFREHKWEIIISFFVLTLFLVSSFIAREFEDVLVKELTGYGVLGMAAYFAGATIATVIAPLSFLPMLPVAVALWGNLTAALLSIAAWSLGAGIAFFIARRYGRPVVRHFVGERRMHYLAGLLPSRHLFFAVLFLRMTFPVDLLSYALGLFTGMRFVPYMAATVLGVMPLAFTFSYFASIPFGLQAGALVVGILVVAAGFPHMRRRYGEIFLSDTLPAREMKHMKESEL